MAFIRSPQATWISYRAWAIHVGLFSFSLFCGTLIASSKLACRPDHMCHLQPSLSKTKVFTGTVASFEEDSLEMPVFELQNYEFIRFSGNPNVQSPYKGPPSPAVDAMWDSLWADNMLISQDLYDQSSPQHPEARVESTATGHSGFFATFEATHQLHCLVSSWINSLFFFPIQISSFLIRKQYTLFRASYVDYYETERNFLLHNPDKYHARLGMEIPSVTKTCRRANDYNP